MALECFWRAEARQREGGPGAPYSHRIMWMKVIQMRELIHEYVNPVRTTDGATYRVRAYGEAQSDGTWVGWLEFAAGDADGPTRATDRETSQASRETLESWAEGLESTYFEGAFERARLVDE
jgi:hypothetical protein